MENSLCKRLWTYYDKQQNGRMNNHNGGIETEDETDLRDQKRIKNFDKQASLRELENTGVDRWILKHNRIFSFKQNVCLNDTRWFKYDRDWFVCKQAALRSSCATLREWSHYLHPPSCSGYNLFSPVWELLEWWANRRYRGAWNNALWSNSSLEKTSRPLKFTTDPNNSMGKSVSYGDLMTFIPLPVSKLFPPCDRFSKLCQPRFGFSFGQFWTLVYLWFLIHFLFPLFYLSPTGLSFLVAFYYLCHVCPSFCRHETTRLPPDGFSWNLILENFF